MNKISKPLNRQRRIALLRKRDGDGCFYCRHLPGGKQTLSDEQVTFDHYIPQAAGGTWDLKNLRLACRKCNNRKGDRVPRADGSIPPPPIRSMSRSAKRAHRPELCKTCFTARMLSGDDECGDCGRRALPQHRSHVYKRRTWECDHNLTWCIACCLADATERKRLQATASGHPSDRPEPGE